MDILALIEAVRVRPAIWNSSVKLHRNRDHVLQLWHEISNELNIECGFAKKKWRGLRENYRKELHKQRSATNNWKSSWAPFDDLFFLQDQFISQKTSENAAYGLFENSMQLKSVTSENEFESMDYPPCVTIKSENKELETRDGCDLEPSVASTSTAKTPMKNVTMNRIDKQLISSNRKSLNLNEMNKKLLTIMRDIKMLNENQVEIIDQLNSSSSKIGQGQELHDADYHFLMSLLPSMRALPRNSKLFIRRKIEKTILDELRTTSRHMTTLPILDSSSESASAASVDSVSMQSN
ncbi:uncharacterized protein LOC111059121 [Nilaparvata lugens]|uniref:uncharacterized protein LOC111059121 n=1 Tax=Nilaparvata lugens TaxID=108931 RepID=UPI000B98B76A|nr:uncharacterized protein LOC111059121 [Nilaparvata lugens]